MEHAFTIKRGTYKLACDVENPHPNKRSRAWHAAPVFKAGMKFIIEDNWQAEAGQPYVRPQSQRFEGLWMHDELFWPIVSHLEPVEEQPSDMLARLDLANWTPELLDALCARGCFTLADAEATVKALVAADVAEHEAREQAKKEAGK